MDPAPCTLPELLNLVRQRRRMLDDVDEDSGGLLAQFEAHLLLLVEDDQEQPTAGSKNHRPKRPRLDEQQRGPPSPCIWVRR